MRSTKRRGGDEDADAAGATSWRMTKKPACAPENVVGLVLSSLFDVEGEEASAAAAAAATAVATIGVPATRTRAG